MDKLKFIKYFIIKSEIIFLIIYIYDKLKFIKCFVVGGEIIFLIYNINRKILYLFNLINFINRLYI